MADYILTERAKQQLKDLYKEGYINFGEVQADKYFEALHRRFEEITEQPLLYPAVNNVREGYRRSLCGRHSIYYKVGDRYIEIMAVIKHQDITDMLDS